MSKKSKIEISYCPKCNWLARSAWMAQELLSTFEENISEVSLIPSEVGGFFEIKANNKLVWDRKTESGFPNVKELKTRVRNIIAPEKELGHIEK